MTSPETLDSTAAPKGRLAVALASSAIIHLVLALLVVFDVAGIGGGFGLGVGPGFGIGSGGGVGLGAVKRRQIFSLEDIPEPVRPRDASADEALKELLVPAKPQAIAVPQSSAKAIPTSAVVRFQRPTAPIGAGVDLGSRFASTGAGTGGLGMGGGGGGAGWSLGSMGAFGKYVGTLRKVGLDVAIVIDATGSMQMIIDDLKQHLGNMATTLQRLVPTARIGAVAFRDRDDGKTATAPRKSEDFLVKWTDLTFNPRKVQSFLGGIVAEGGGDYEEAVKDGLEAAMQKLKWRQDAKKVLILVGSSPPHQQDNAAIRQLVAGWRAQGGVVSTIDVSWQLHQEHERKLHRWLYGEELKEVPPLPDFYAAVKDSYSEISKEGGGDFIALGEDAALVRNVLVLTFGPQWQKDLGKVARGL